MSLVVSESCGAASSECLVVVAGRMQIWGEDSAVVGLQVVCTSIELAGVGDVR